MGLDVYLYKANKQKLLVAERQEKKFEKYAEKKWKGKGKEGIIFKKDRDALSAQLEKKALSMGLNQWGSIPDEVETLIELPSAKYSEHMFRIGYFRSSYNDSGVNNILRQITGEDLYDIFQPNDEYRIYPDWEEARRKTVELLEKMVEFSRTNGELYIQKVFKHGVRELDRKEIMDIVLKEKNEKLKEKFKVSLKDNNGYCPCSIEKSENTKCICKKMREEKICECEVYEWE